MQPSFDVITVTLNPAIDRTLVIPAFAAGKVNRVEQIREVAGGKGVNVASALADFGVRVAATGFLGRDNDALFRSLFQRKGIADHFIRINGATRVGLKIVDPPGQQTTDVNFPGLSPSAREFDVLASGLKQLTVGDPGWVVISGSLPPGMPADAHARLAELVKAQGWNALVDTSGEPLRRAAASGPAILKPNIDELQALAGHRLSDRAALLQAARQALAHGAGLIVVSMGEEGALFVTTGQVLAARPPAVEVAGTVGAGDAMVAGIIAARLRNLPIKDCARLATAFSLVLLTRGQNDALLTPEAVTPWLDRVSIDTL